MKRFLLALFVSLILCNIVFANGDKNVSVVSLIKNVCEVGGEYNYWLMTNNRIKKEYVGDCPKGPSKSLGQIIDFSSPTPENVMVIIVGILLLMFAIWLIKRNKDAKRLKGSKINKIKKEKRPTETELSSSDIGARLKKLRQMYKDGILSKVEFEKAKNKLLK